MNYKIEFKEDFSVIDTDQNITVDCNSITVINNGLTTVTINGSLDLIPGASFVSEGNVTERNKSIYLIQLNGGKVTVIRKNYIG